VLVLAKNGQVMEQVSARVHDILEWLIPNYAKRVSDVHYSSDSSEDEVPQLMADEEMVETYRRRRSTESILIV